jgi:vacuolar-type H+-ATPase subunit I/STV1
MFWLNVSHGLAAGPAGTRTGRVLLSSEIDEIRRRLTAVEQEQANLREQVRQSQRATDLYSLVDQDVADVRLAFSQQRQILNAIGQTQAEHTTALRRQGDILGGLVLEMTTIRHTQTEHGHLLRQVLDRLPAAEN